MARTKRRRSAQRSPASFTGISAKSAAVYGIRKLEVRLVHLQRVCSIVNVGTGGRPDVMKLVKEAYYAWGAEVVFITSNYQGNKEIMEGCKEAGIPAFVGLLFFHLCVFLMLLSSGHALGFLSFAQWLSRAARPGSGNDPLLDTTYQCSYLQCSSHTPCYLSHNTLFCLYL